METISSFVDVMGIVLFHSFSQGELFFVCTCAEADSACLARTLFIEGD
jgi:hypothetical protein